MNDETNKPKQSDQPTHEAAKVVIPFDIDMSAIESKISELERRMSAVFSGKQQQQPERQQEHQQEPQKPQQQQPQQPQSQPQDVMPDLRSQPMSYSPQAQSGGRGGDQGIDENDKTLAVMLVTIGRMSDLVRQINDTVLLMYSQMMSGRNNA